MRMTKVQAIALSRLIEAIRPEWNFPGIMAAIGKVVDRDDDPAIVAIAALTCCQDKDAETPAAMTNPVYWPAWQPNTPKSTPTPKAVDQILAPLPPRDPEASRRGYLAACQALEESRTKETA